MMFHRTSFFSSCFLLVIVSAAHAQRTGFSGNTCPSSCPSSVRPVCGTNNRVYRNRCELQQAACNSNIRLKNDGPCLSRDDCLKDCSSSYEPICANNGKTYDNECHYDNARCEDSDIDKQFEGVCPVSPGSSPTSTNAVVRPSTLLAGSSSQSPSSSSSNVRPGVGGLLISAIANRPSVQTSSSSSNAPASVGGIAIGTPVNIPGNTQSAPSRNPVPERNCRNECSPLRGSPVCGSDGLTYSSECELNVAICNNPGLRKVNDGVCRKDCSIQCPTEVVYQCGTNGVTYLNPCELEVARCKDPSIRNAGNGQCVTIRNTCERLPCNDVVNPVCGSDGVTYRNQCSLENEARCNENKNGLLKFHDGECQAQRCTRDCPGTTNPVCGTDGVTYPNHCILIRETCITRSDVVKAYDGSCRRRTRN